MTAGLKFLEDFEGMDEMTPMSSRGWAVLNGDVLNGMILFYQGAESGFAGKREKRSGAAK
jgi:hypothetical protein